MTRLDMMQLELYRGLFEIISRELCTLPDKPDETPESTLCALWQTAAGWPRSARGATPRELLPLDATGTSTLRSLVERRLSGIPLAHLTGRQDFMGIELLAGGEALVPRAETELLGYAALSLVRNAVNERGQATVIDVCTGSGNVALALAHHEPNARVYASDLSTEAIGLAKRNAQKLGLEQQVEFRTGDLLAPFDQPMFHGAVDVVTCNPPYISTAKVGHMAEEIAAHEPQLAFDGGPFGVRILQRFITEAPRFLRPGGWIAFEVGLGQGPSIAQRLRSNTQTYTDIQIIEDNAGQIRSILARGQMQ